MGEDMSLKKMIGLRVMKENLSIIEDVVSKNPMDSSVSFVINEAIIEWLASRGYKPVQQCDGRHGRWERQKVQNGVNAESK